ncbi:MAG: Zn-ribbon domain-containing OB-fold protein [Nocardiopsaceae bacterium]|nr:Zn-ribbon domain-containing OB-fold protein [Nocardiopsaceae bacterium]
MSGGEGMAIVPGMTELTRPYWDAAAEGRLVIRECRGCGRLQHPPVPACPACHGADFGWREASGEGAVYSYTIIRHATHAALADAIPYVVALVELAEGPRLVTGITGCPPESVTVGMPVRAAFRRVTDEVTLPYFEPA